MSSCNANCKIHVFMDVCINLVHHQIKIYKQNGQKKWITIWILSITPSGIYLFKVSNGKTRTTCKISSKPKIASEKKPWKTPEMQLNPGKILKSPRRLLQKEFKYIIGMSKLMYLTLLTGDRLIKYLTIKFTFHCLKAFSSRSRWWEKVSPIISRHKMSPKKMPWRLIFESHLPMPLRKVGWGFLCYGKEERWRKCFLNNTNLEVVF